MYKTTRALILTTTLLLAGCVTTLPQLQVTYHSEPEGATFYQGDQRMGLTPYTLTYMLEPSNLQEGKFIAYDTHVVWVSGASAYAKGLTTKLVQGGTIWTSWYTFNRPDVAGRADDYNYALQLQNLSVMQRQARAQEVQAYEQHRQANLQEQQLWQNLQKQNQ